MAARHSILIEAAVESAAGAVAAARAGAHRIELCANLSEGGTTPSAGTIGASLEKAGVDVVVMVRPRGGDFLYSDLELDVMERDVTIALALGAHGIVLGILSEDGGVDVERTRRMVEAAHPLPVTFHRAFDLANDLGNALEAVIACGVQRVLTSGGAPRAADGVEELAALVVRGGGRISVMPGGGISAGNAARIVRDTGVHEIHVGGTIPIASGMRFRRPGISFARPPLPDEYTLTAIDDARLRAVIDAVSGMEDRPR